jgi:hypothetical protein
MAKADNITSTIAKVIDFKTTFLPALKFLLKMFIFTLSP